MRDLEQYPYTAEEQRVANYLMDLTEIGGGDDPIGFLIASHAALLTTLREVQEKEHARDEIIGHH